MRRTTTSIKPESTNDCKDHSFMHLKHNGDDVLPDFMSKFSSSNENKCSPEINEILNNPWNIFVFEVTCLRDYFVEHAVKSCDSKAGNEFLTLTNYTQTFLKEFSRKFELKTPSIIYFFKSKFEYPDDINNQKEPTQEQLYKGYGHKTDVVEATKELIKMQETLDEVSRSPKSFYVKDNLE